MKAIFIFSLLTLIVLSIVCWEIQPRPNLHGSVLLTWSTDGNPDRIEQENLFAKLYPKYKISVVPQALDGFDVTKNIVQSVADTGPDMIDAYSQDDMQSYVKSGVAWDVTGVLKARGVNVNTDLWNAEKSECMYEGKCYGFAANAFAAGIFYNKTDFDRAGLPYPRGRWTWEQFRADAQKLTVRNTRGVVIRYGCLETVADWENIIHMWGGRLFAPGGSACIVDSPQSISGLQFVQDLVFKYRVSPSDSEAGSMATMGGAGGNSQGIFGTNQVAMATGGRYWFIYLRKYYQSLRVGCADEPLGLCRVTGGGSRVTLINRFSPHREAALNFLVYLAGPQYNALIDHESDGIGPVPKYDFTPTFLHDPQYPKETDNEVWRSEERFAVQPEISPYISQQEAGDIEQNDIDLLEANQESVPSALHDIQVKINAAIAKNIAEDPKLEAQYDRDAPLRRGPFQPYIQAPQPDIPSEPDL